MPNADLIKQARELCEKATPGPWMPVDRGNTVRSLTILTAAGKRVCGGISPTSHDVDFICISRTLLPALADALEEEKKKNGRLSGAIQEWIDGKCISQKYLTMIGELTARAESAERERDEHKAALMNWHEQEPERKDVIIVDNTPTVPPGKFRAEQPTNADRIRAMSDEELASEMLFFRPSDSVFIGTTYEECSRYHGIDGSFYRTADQAIKANIDWLRQPAERSEKDG